MSTADATTPEWKATVGVSTAEDLRAELDLRRRASPPVRSVWVTDLLDLRTAYFQRVAPVPITGERRQRMDLGRELHFAIGSALSQARHLEVRVQRQGIVGQIDLMESRPTELKTTTSLPAPEELAGSRPQYLEQLAMYCALVGRPEGRLLLVQPVPEGAANVAVFDVKFHDLEGVFNEMLGRAERLRLACDQHQVDRLPACEWRGRGCAFQEAKVCDCSGTEPSPGHTLIDFLDSCGPNPVEADRVRSELAAQPAEPPVVRRFRDLLYPRRVFYERTHVDVPERGGEAAPAFVRDDLYREVSDLLEGGLPGEVTREPPIHGRPMESVACFRGTPYLLKVSKAWRRSPPSDLLANQPHYFLELGFRCAAMERPEGLLLIAYERAEGWPEKLEAFRVRFSPLRPVGDIATFRADALEGAVHSKDPRSLPPCPSWMFERCDYREVCGCGAASTLR